MNSKKGMRTLVLYLGGCVALFAIVLFTSIFPPELHTSKTCLGFALGALVGAIMVKYALRYDIWPFNL